MSILDTVADAGNVGLHRLDVLYTGPDFVKSASEVELRPVKRLSPSYYGDPRHHHYPMHTKAAVWANYGLFLENQRNGSHSKVDADMIESRLLHAGRVHGIEASLGRLKIAFAKAAPVADDDRPDEDYAIVWHLDDGRKERHWRVCNGQEVIKAAECLQKWRDKFPYAERRAVAIRLFEKAAALGVAISGELHEFIEKQAGYGTCLAQDAIGLIEDRFQASRKGPGPLSEDQTAIFKLADAIRANPAAIRRADIRVKIAAELSAFDERNGLTFQIRQGLLPQVEDVLFAVTREKVAAVADSFTRTITGSIYRLDTLGQLKLADVRECLGTDMADALTSDGLHLDIEKAAAVVPTLDRSAAASFDQLMEDVGLAPSAKEAGVPIKISNQFLAGLLPTK